MPRYKIQSPEGKTITIEGDAPPTEQELEQIFQESSTRPFGEQLKGDVAQGAYGFANEALLNIPDLATSKVPQLARFNPGEPKDTSEKVSRFVGSGAGFVAGLPQKIGAKSVGTVAKPLVKGLSKQVGKRFAKVGTEAAIGSLASAPFRAMKEGKDFSPKEEAIRTGAAFGAGGIAGRLGARFSKGGRYLAAKDKLKSAEDRLSKLTSELTQIGDKKIATTAGKEIKPSRTFEELNKQIANTKAEIMKHRDSLIQSRNRNVSADEYLTPMNNWIMEQSQRPEFTPSEIQQMVEFAKRAFVKHQAEGMDLVRLEKFKESLQSFTKSLLESTAPTESQGARKQAMDQLRFGIRKLIEKEVPEVASINKKYGPLIEAEEATGKMAEAVSKSVRPTAFQTLKSKLPYIGGKSPVDSGAMARELERRLPSYTEEIASQAKEAARASAKMAQLRPRQIPPSGPTSWAGGVRPAPPRPGSGLVTGPTPTPQLTGPSQPVQSIGPRRLPQTFFEGEGFQMRPSEFGGSPTPQIPVSSQRALPAPPNLYGETFRTLTPEEQMTSRLPQIMESLPKGPNPVFARLQLPGEYSPPRPVVEPTPLRGSFPLEGEGIRIEGPTGPLTPNEKGIRSRLLNRLLERRRIFPPKNLEE